MAVEISEWSREMAGHADRTLLSRPDLSTCPIPPHLPVICRDIEGQSGNGAGFVHTLKTRQCLAQI